MGLKLLKRQQSTWLNIESDVMPAKRTSVSAVKLNHITKERHANNN